MTKFKIKFLWFLAAILSIGLVAYGQPVAQGFMRLFQAQATATAARAVLGVAGNSGDSLTNMTIRGSSQSMVTNTDLTASRMVVSDSAKRVTNAIWSGFQPTQLGTNSTLIQVIAGASLTNTALVGSSQSKATNTDLAALAFALADSSKTLTNSPGLVYSVPAGGGAQVGFADYFDGAGSIDASATLTLASTNRGFLPPRLTTTQKAAITPATGLMVYDSTVNALQFYDGTVWRGGGKSWVIFAASDSPAADKEAADFVCTGANDQDTIYPNVVAQYALGRKNFWFSPGNYQLTTNYSRGSVLAFTNYTGLVFQGAGNASTRLYLAANIPTLNNLFAFFGCTNIAIRDLELDGNLSNQTNSLTTQAVIQCATAVGHESEFCDGISVERCRVHGGGFACIAFQGTMNSRMIWNDIWNSTVHPIEIDSSSLTPITPGTNITCSFNYVHDVAAGAAVHFDQVIGLTSDGLVIDNKGTSSGSGLVIGADDLTTFDGVAVYGNQFQISNLRLLGTKGMTVTLDDPNSTFQFVNPYIEGAVSFSPSGDANYPANTGAKVKSVLMTHLTLVPSGTFTNLQAIYMGYSGASASTLTGAITISDSYILVATNYASTAVAIAFTNSTGVISFENVTFDKIGNTASANAFQTKQAGTIVRDCKFYGNSGSGQIGIYLDADTTGGTSHTNRLEGNRFYNVTTAIKLQGSSDNFIKDNRALGSSATTYSENVGAANCTRNVWINNTIPSGRITRGDTSQGLYDFENNLYDNQISSGADVSAPGSVTTATDKKMVYRVLNKTNSLAPFAWVEIASGDNNSRNTIYWGGRSGTGDSSAILQKWVINNSGITSTATPSVVMRMSSTGLRIGSDNSPTATFLHLDAATTAKSSLRIDAGTAPTTPNAGDIWHDSTQQALSAYTSGVKGILERTLFTMTADGGVSNSVTATSLYGTGVGTKTLPASFFVAGKTVRMKTKGYFSSSATPGTFLIEAYLGSTVVCTTTAKTPAVSVANDGWDLEVDVTCRTTGTNGTFVASGRWLHGDGLTATEYVWPMITTGTTTVDTTASQAADCKVTLGADTAGDAVIGQVGTIEIRN